VSSKYDNNIEKSVITVITQTSSRTATRKHAYKENDGSLTSQYSNKQTKATASSTVKNKSKHNQEKEDKFLNELMMN
jgi:hypothetical protein